jgi:pyruvate dehydrogenase E2 component (dihydrolipoamide acetyltransferase)
VKVEMTMPDLSTASTTVKIVSWLVKTGQPVQRGQPILEVETDKATMEVEAYLAGVLSEIIAEGDTEVEVGQVIAIIETRDEVNQDIKPAAQTKPEIPPPGQTINPTAVPPVGPKPGGMFARNREKAGQPATETKQTAVPTPAQASEPHPQGVLRNIQWTTAQRVVGQRMQESKGTIPHYYLQTSVNAEPMIKRRNSNPGDKTAWDSFFVYATGMALKQYYRLCVSLRDGQPVWQQVDAVGVAVDMEGDLYVIQVQQPASKTPEQISTEIRAQVQRLKAGDPEARKIHPNNLTVTNLGASGVESFTAIINPPEAAILAIGKIAPAVVAVDGQIAIQNRVSLTLSVDHRIVNGRYAADFLQRVVEILENL